MNIYKLQYTDKATGDADLLAKGTYEVVEGKQFYINGTQAIVYIGQIVEIPGTYDPDGKEITPPVYYTGVFYDLMTTEEFDFGTNEIFPTDCVHSFAGYEKNAEGTDIDPEELEEI
tara:strand:+ start:1754 stop:2101 length:348 start_codon:yes stop_codon:yes gene_type:complete